MFRYARICWPKNANATITAKDTATACHAARLTVFAERPLVSDKKIGMVPIGSMITNSVTKTSVRSTTLRTSLIGTGSRGHDLGGVATGCGGGLACKGNQPFVLIGVGGVAADLVVDLAVAVVVAGPGGDQAEVARECSQGLPRSRVVVLVVDLDAGQSGLLQRRQPGLVECVMVVPRRPRVRDHADPTGGVDDLDHLDQVGGVPIHVGRSPWAEVLLERLRPVAHDTLVDECVRDMGPAQRSGLALSLIHI